MKRYEALAGPWTIRVCPECGRVANACGHVEHAGVEPVEVEVAPSTTTGAVEALELVGLALGPDASIMPDPRVREASRIVREALAAIGGGRRVTEEATG